jgi:hypothetical protein
MKAEGTCEYKATNDSPLYLLCYSKFVRLGLRAIFYTCAYIHSGAHFHADANAPAYAGENAAPCTDLGRGRR